MRRYRLTNEPELHERYQQHGYQQRDTQNQRNGPRETQQEVVYHAGNHNQEGEECDTDGQCSREYGFEEIEKEVKKMCNLGEMIARENIEKGHSIGLEQG